MNIQIYSREGLKELSKNGFPFNTALISYYDEGSSPIELKGSVKPVIEIHKQINDVRYVDNPKTFKQKDFKDIAKFIKKCAENDYDIICQCEFGVSRSSATAMAIKEYYFHNGIDIFENYDYYPNQVFFNSVYNALLKE